MVLAFPENVMYFGFSIACIMSVLRICDDTPFSLKTELSNGIKICHFQFGQKLYRDLLR